MACWEWVFRMQSSPGKDEAVMLDYYLKRSHSGVVIGIPKSWAEFLLLLLLGSCYNFELQTLRKVLKTESLPGRIVTESREDQDIKGNGTDRGEVCSDEAPMDLFLSLPRVQELSPPSRNLKGKQWALILCTHQEWPTRAQGRREERERAVIYFFSCWLQWTWLTMGPSLALVEYIWFQCSINVINFRSVLKSTEWCCLALGLAQIYTSCITYLPCRVVTRIN